MFDGRRGGGGEVVATVDPRQARRTPSPQLRKFTRVLPRGMLSDKNLNAATDESACAYEFERPNARTGESETERASERARVR